MSHHPLITFARLTQVSIEDLVAHMSDPRVAEHMPLLNFEWTAEEAHDFVTAKEETWSRDGLGHWAFLSDGAYVGWGGFQKEGEDWDFGLVLKPEHFGRGIRIYRQAIEFASADSRIDSVTFLIPPSRKKLGVLTRIGAEFVGDVEYAGVIFHQYRLDTQ